MFRIQSTALRQSGEAVVIAPGASVEVRDTVGDLARVYADAGKVSELGNPFNADENGAYDFYVDIDDFYDVTTSAQGESVDKRWYVTAKSGYESRAALVTAIADGFVPDDGKIITAGDLAYRGEAGATVIPSLPGLIPAGERINPRHFGAVGDGVADDTAAVRAWLEAGGGTTTQGSTYLIDPFIIINDVHVVCAPDTVFKQRSGWTNWAIPDGMIQFRRDVYWRGGTFDGSRDDPAVMDGLPALRGTGVDDVTMNDYKAAMYIRAMGTAVHVDIKGVTAINCVNLGFHFFTANSDDPISGKLDELETRNCGMSVRMDRCVNLHTGTLRAYDTDNRIGEDDENWFPAFYHVMQQIRCVRSPINEVYISGVRGRPGEWFRENDTGFINGFTQTSCEYSRIGKLHVDNFIATQGITTDSTPETVAELTSALGFSDVSNDYCGVDDIYVEGGWTQGWELIPGLNTNYGRVELISNHARQGVERGTTGVSLHADGRTKEDVPNFRFDSSPTADIVSLYVEGFHYGIVARHSGVHIHRCKVRGTRADGVFVSDLGNPIVTGVARDDVRASVIIDWADIQWCGGVGVRIANGDNVEIYGGIIANNCQMVGYDDPTFFGAAFTRDTAVLYDEADDNRDTLNNLVIKDVQMDGKASFSRASGASYIPDTPQAGTFETLPDPRIFTMFLVLANGQVPAIGRRLTINDVDGAGQNVDVWIRKQQGPVLLVEVDTATYAGAWAPNTTALSGTWDLTGNDLVGTGGALESELDGSGVVSTPNGYAALVTRTDGNTGFLMSDSLWGTFGTITGDFTGGAISLVDVGYDYTLAQTEEVDLSDAYITQQYYAPFNRQTINGFLGLGASMTRAIVAGSINATQTNLRIITENLDATDDLDTITNVTEGQLYIIRPAASSRTVVVKHGTGNIYLTGEADFSMDHKRDHLLLICDDEGNLCQVSGNNEA